MKRPLPLVNGKQVKVYRNLTNKCLSVMQQGKVVGHAQLVRLTDVSFQVSQTGRDRCLREKRKNVHAFVVGKLQKADAIAEGSPQLSGIKVNYNPYKADYFFKAKTGEPIYQAKSVVITPRGVFVEA